MTTAYISHINNDTGKNLAATIERVSDGYKFKPSANVFVDPADPGVSYSQLRVPMIEGALQDAYSYVGAVSNLSGVGNVDDPGDIRIRIHDEDFGNKTIELIEEIVVGSRFVRVDKFVSTRATPDDVSSRINVAIKDPVLGVLLDEPTTVPPNSPTIEQALMLLFMMYRNRREAGADQMTLFNKDGSPVMVATITETDAASSRGKLANAV